MANKKMAAQSRGSLQTCDWGGGGGGQVCGPQDTTPVMWSNVFARFERITLEHGRFTNSKSRSDEDWLTGLYQIKLEKTMEGSTPSLIIHSFFYLLGVHQFSIRYSTSGRVTFAGLRPLSSVPG